MDSLEQTISQAQIAIREAATLAALDELRVLYLGKKGLLTAQLKQLGSLPADQRREAGQVINLAKQAVSDAIDTRRQALEQEGWPRSWRPGVLT